MKVIASDLIRNNSTSRTGWFKLVLYKIVWYYTNMEGVQEIPGLADHIKALISANRRLSDISWDAACALAESGPQSPRTVTALAAGQILHPQVPLQAFQDINAAWDSQDEDIQRHKVEAAADACQVLSDRARGIKAFVEAIPAGPDREKYKALEGAADAAIAALDAYFGARKSMGFDRMREDLQDKISSLENLFSIHAPRLIRAYREIPRTEN